MAFRTMILTVASMTSVNGVVVPGESLTSTFEISADDDNPEVHIKVDVAGMGRTEQAEYDTVFNGNDIGNQIFRKLLDSSVLHTDALHIHAAGGLSDADPSHLNDQIEELMRSMGLDPKAVKGIV